jgi:rod shape-determining protein MreB
MFGSASPLDEEISGSVRGRDLVSGLPKEIAITSYELRDAMQRSISSIVEAIRSTIEETPPELTADLVNRQIYMAGGGAMLRGLDRLIASEAKLHVKIVDDPLTAVARGCGFVLENVDQLKSVLVSTEREAYI